MQWPWGLLPILSLWVQVQLRTTSSQVVSGEVWQQPADGTAQSSWGETVQFHPQADVFSYRMAKKCGSFTYAVLRSHMTSVQFIYYKLSYTSTAYCHPYNIMWMTVVMVLSGETPTFRVNHWPLTTNWHTLFTCDQHVYTILLEGNLDHPITFTVAPDKQPSEHHKPLINQI